MKKNKSKGIRPNIHDIKWAVEDKQPYFFNKKTMMFFGQRLEDFSINKMEDGIFKISAPRKDLDGVIHGRTVRFFEISTKNLYTSLKKAQDAKNGI